MFAWYQRMTSHARKGVTESGRAGGFQENETFVAASRCRNLENTATKEESRDEDICRWGSRVLEF